MYVNVHVHACNWIKSHTEEIHTMLLKHTFPVVVGLVWVVGDVLVVLAADDAAPRALC
jgi:hypothetical protein